jgi:hypothetical protein
LPGSHLDPTPGQTLPATAPVQAEMRTEDGGTRRLTTAEVTNVTSLLVATGTEIVARLPGCPAARLGGP